MRSPIRERALARQLKESADRLEKISQSQPTYDPRGIITPPYLPIPFIESVPATTVEPISISNTKITGEIDNMPNITAITQEDDEQTNKQVEAEEEGEERHTREDVQQLKNRVRDKLIDYCNKHNQALPPKIKVSGHDLVSLASNGLLETILCLKETNIVVESDPKLGDDIQCCDG